MRPNWPTAQWALVSWFLSLLTARLAATVIEEAKTWLVHGGALAIVCYYIVWARRCWHLLPPLPHLCPHHSDLFIDHVEFHESARRSSGLGTRCRGSHHWLGAYDWHAPFCVWFLGPHYLTTISARSAKKKKDFAIKPTYFLASVMLVMFWDIRLYDSYDLLDDENSLTWELLSIISDHKKTNHASWCRNAF